MHVLREGWWRARAHRDPFPWLATAPGELFSIETARSLAEAFPNDGFTRFDTSTRATGKRYRNDSRPIRWPADGDSLPPLWQDLVRDIMAPEYRAHVARLLDQEPMTSVELRLVHHGPGDWLGPHTDREDKLFSHIIYFNPSWRAEWGGCLEILRSDDPGSAVASVVPDLGASVLFRRADNSWHQVTRMAQDVPFGRRSLLVHGLRS